MKGPRRGFSTALLTVLILMAAAQTRPFVRDTHYYLGFAAALATCFDWDEAHLISSANLMLDGTQVLTHLLACESGTSAGRWTGDLRIVLQIPGNECAAGPPICGTFYSKR